jgi:hypothetical protein
MDSKELSSRWTDVGFWVWWRSVWGGPNAFEASGPENELPPATFLERML